MKNWIYIIVITSAIVVLAPSLVENALAFTLTVDLSDKPFGDASVWVQIQGNNGFLDKKWYDWSSIRTGPNSGQVTWNLPDSSFPIGENYKVCVSSKFALSIVAPNCSLVAHQGSDERVSISLN